MAGASGGLPPAVAVVWLRFPGSAEVQSDPSRVCQPTVNPTTESSAPRSWPLRVSTLLFCLDWIMVFGFLAGGSGWLADGRRRISLASVRPRSAITVCRGLFFVRWFRGSRGTGPSGDRLLVGVKCPLGESLVICLLLQQGNLFSLFFHRPECTLRPVLPSPHDRFRFLPPVFRRGAA